MKNLPVIFMLFLLAACAPAVTEVLTPTITIIPSPMPTATPVAVNGVTGDAEGQ